MITCKKCKEKYPVYYAVYDKKNWTCMKCSQTTSKTQKTSEEKT